MGAKSSRLTSQNNRSDGHLLGYFRKSFVRGGGAAIPEAPPGSNVPVGTLMLFTGGSNPDSSNYLVADGSAISRTTYADLFSVTGTTFGSGDGSTTFNLPDLSGQTIRHNTTPGVDTTVSAPTHSHGTLTVASSYANSGNTADANNVVRNAVNNAVTSTSGSGSMTFRDHDALPLVSYKKCQLPVGALLYTFRDLTKARQYCTCLSANGSAYSSSTYPDLYTVTSTSYGGTSGSPDRPDFRGCFPKCKKDYTPGNNYAVDSYPSHNHGPYTGVDANSTNVSTRQDGSPGVGNFSANGTTNSAGVGNATELRGTNFAAHPIVVASNSTTTVQGLGVFGTNLLEPGDLIFYLGTSPDTSKFTSLNGVAKVAADYPTLADSVESNFINGSTVQVLNCTDRYLRGVDAGAGRDPDGGARTFGGTGNANGASVCGTFQDQSLTGHTHTFYAYTSNAGNNQYPNYGNIPYRYQTAGTINSYGITYNIANTTSNIRIGDLKVNILMVLDT